MRFVFVFVLALVLLPASLAQTFKVIGNAQCHITKSAVANQKCANESLVKLMRLLNQKQPIISRDVWSAITTLEMKGSEGTIEFKYEKVFTDETLTLTIYDDSNTAIYSASRPILMLSRKDIEMLALGRGNVTLKPEKWESAAEKTAKAAKEEANKAARNAYLDAVDKAEKERSDKWDRVIAPQLKACAAQKKQDSIRRCVNHNPYRGVARGNEIVNTFRENWDADCQENNHFMLSGYGYDGDGGAILSCATELKESPQLVEMNNELANAKREALRKCSAVASEEYCQQ